ncbi:DNA topoisomerase 3 [Saezia sanguinis]|uniref:DNA topoisomerase n=1 Tax=Saezia sanguinis TaxID=1965230 RepID=A0A433SG98_9BURK|nr:DNA topoisomerase 3 [Saezia sanguinis]
MGFSELDKEQVVRLFLCEKPSQGKDIAKVLGATQRGEGFIAGHGVTVTWCIGHLLETAPPEAYDPAFKKWALEHLPILPAAWKVEVKPAVSKQFNVIKKLLQKTTELVIATDADREGEMIGREIVDFCGYRGPIKRLWLSALNESSIRTALASLKPGNETLPLYYSALTRSRADWIIGMNLSRLFTLLGKNAGYHGVLSVGRVQTPTLALVVRRDREISNFVPVPFWTVDVGLSASNQRFIAQWLPQTGCTDEAGRCIQQTVAQAAEHAIKSASHAIVKNVQTERLREGPPLLFDLGTLQEVCSKQLGLDVQETLDIAQSLYEKHKATTYPRTDCGYLPQSMLAEVPAVMQAIVKTDPSIQTLLDKLDLSIRSRAWNDEKITAHHGIIPTMEPINLSALNDKELTVYKLIRSHYLAQFLANHEYDRTVAEFDCAGHSLRASGKQIVVMGWRSVLVDQDNEDQAAVSQVLPALSQNMQCIVTGTELKSLKTMPPKPFTQGELVKAMKGVAKYVSDPRLKQILKETTGIGTEATRAGIIKGLLARGYLVAKGRSVRASDAAFTLIDAIPQAIADPGLTAVWEQALNSIEQGQMTSEAFIAKQSAWIDQLVKQYAASSLSIKLPDSPACPLCKSAMRRRKGRNGDFYSCSQYPNCSGSMPIDGQKSSKRQKSPSRFPKTAGS